MAVQPFLSIKEEQELSLPFIVAFSVQKLCEFQHEYMHRLDYQWKRQLKNEQEQASATRLVNKMLLQNILPKHVGGCIAIFLSKF